MPTYAYRCRDCNSEDSQWRPMAEGPGSLPCTCGGVLRAVIGKGVQFALRQSNGEVRGDRWGYRPDLAERPNDPNAYVYSAKQEQKRVDALLRKGYTRGGAWDDLERKMKYPSAAEVAAEKQVEQSNRDLAKALSDMTKEDS